VPRAIPRIRLLPLEDSSDGSRGKSLPVGSRRLQRDGYVTIKLPADHPLFPISSNGWIGEHRYVMALTLDRVLRPHEEVHHKNNRHSDNRPSNLEVWIVAQPRGVRASEGKRHCSTCRCFE